MKLTVIIDILPCLQFRLGRILGNVLSQPFELSLMPNEMVERVLLPKAASASEPAVDLRSSKVLPRLTLLQHRCFIHEGR